MLFILNQRTILEPHEIAEIINTFNMKEEVKDYSVLVDYDEIANNNYSFSIGQYFEIEIIYEKLTPDEFNKRKNEYKKTIEKLFKENDELEKNIINDLGALEYDET